MYGLCHVRRFEYVGEKWEQRDQNGAEFAIVWNQQIDNLLKSAFYDEQSWEVRRHISGAFLRSNQEFFLETLHVQDKIIFL